MDSRKSWEADVILNDGGIAALRAIRPDDREKLHSFYARVSDESKYLRFFGNHPVLQDEDLQRWIDTDGHDKVTLVMLEREAIIAVAGYELIEQFLPARVGDVSFLVQDSHQSRGCGNILLEHLAEIGREGGIQRFYAEMLMNNRQMAQVFIRAGYSATPEYGDGLLTVDFKIEPNSKSREVVERRELRAEANSISRLLSPNSIAVVGTIEGVGSIIPSLVQGNYRGNLHILTTHPGEASVTETLKRLDVDVDVLLVEHDPGNITEIMAAASTKNAKGIIMVAGNQMAHISEETSRDLVLAARDNGLRALGPAALGIINTDPSVSLNSTPAPMPLAGRIGIFTQSSGVGTLVLSRALERGLGISSFIAAGSFADVTGNDVMQYWGSDDNTSICLLSLDSIGNPRKFFRVLRRLALEKFVIVFMPSRALRSSSHYDVELSSQLEKVDTHALDETIRNTGSMVVTSREAMYDIAQLLDRQPLPQGNRIALISNSTGLSSQMEQSALRFGLIPQEVVASDQLINEVEAALENPEIDAVLCAVVEINTGDFLKECRNGLEVLAKETQKVPLIASFIGFDKPHFQQASLPVFDNYADALQSLQQVLTNETKRAEARPQPDDEIGEGDIDKAQEIVQRVLTESPQGRWTTDNECAEILDAYGIGVVPWVEVASTDEAVAAAETLGWDVVLKSLSPIVRGRSEWPTVIRHIRDEHSMKDAWNTLREMAVELEIIPADSNDISALNPVVQAHATSGASLTIRAVENPVVGPIISTGISGIPNDLLNDKTWRVPPIRRSDAASMLGSLKASPLLTGYRGSKASRLSTVEDIIMGVSKLKDDISSIVEIELTPVIAGVNATEVVGARMRIAPLKSERDPLARAFTQ